MKKGAFFMEKNKMCLRLLLIALTVLISNISGVETIKAENKGPVAEITNTDFIAEPVIEGNDIIHDFVIKNSGTEPLEISRVKTG
jgi:hypothetical protein